MSDNIFSPTERQKLEKLARRRGFKSLRGYLQTLIQEDAERNKTTSPLAADEEFGDPVESLRTGWSQAMRGDVITLDEFRKSMEDDD